MSTAVPDLVAGAEAAYVEAWVRLIEARGGGRVERAPGFVLVSTGLPVSFFNSLFVTAEPPDPAAVLARADELFDGLPYTARWRRELDGALRPVAQAAGLSDQETVPAMALAPLPDPVPLPAVAGVEIRPVDDAASIEACLDVTAEAFGMDRRLTAQVFTPDCYRGPVEAVVAWAGDRPVGTAALVRVGDIAGVYSVGTAPGWRGRGVGEAVTWRVVADGAGQGCAWASLQASDMGLPVYERMGFRVVSTYEQMVRSAG